ncbi:hypothetical protein [Sporosarcina sp. G11-34]|uniref:hypothetical protein n=1 Tax=Sporosarcina sp. G11-34 TaxID=2849605 RepID=UPI0022A90F22|nr:hypothetical protein [Sporosarcina sp. G11-34]MCZ2257753.1 hypothetical protein [Sporosarcina sp. G11-34]
MITNYNKSIKTEKKTGSYSWPLIIFMLIIFWPVGVFFLVSRLRVDKKSSLSLGRKMTIWGWVIVGMGVISWPTSIAGGFFSGTFRTMFFISAGLALVYIGKKSSVNAVKYKKYISMIINNNIRSIATLASAIPVSYDTAMEDLQKMIGKGFFEDAYINFNAGEIVLSKDAIANSKVSNHKVEMIVVTCTGCGANNKIEKGGVGACQYCGSLISR